MTSQEEFELGLLALCEKHGLSAVAIYARYTKKITPSGDILSAERLIWYSDDALVVEEAAHHFQRIADGHKH